MALLAVPVSTPEGDVPADVEVFLGEANRRMEAFVEERVRQPIHAFVASDYRQAYLTLREIRRHNMAPGTFFCEWGSGLGAVTCLAAMLGFRSVGIEIERELVRRSVRLASDHDLSPEFYEGSFIPTGGDSFADGVEEFSWLETRGADAHEDMGLDPEDFDVIFAYPWPGEEKVVFEMFEHYASDGALLVTYHGIDALKIQRKVSERDDW
jgi:hypothetical protein